ncbi:channel accessory protein ArfB [Mycobacterium sp. 050134]|uniref:channel accessory protein ArfB n=1 Tax=Mycobacterium sp. 050134 TaxID=3096111 RepID=UPI002EDB931E
MGFVIQWLCYLIAFVAGSAVACLIANVVIRRASNQQGSADPSGPARPGGGE